MFPRQLQYFCMVVASALAGKTHFLRFTCYDKEYILNWIQMPIGPINPCVVNSIFIHDLSNIANLNSIFLPCVKFCGHLSRLCTFLPN